MELTKSIDAQKIAMDLQNLHRSTYRYFFIAKGFPSLFFSPPRPLLSLYPAPLPLTLNFSSPTSLASHPSPLYPQLLPSPLTPFPVPLPSPLPYLHTSHYLSFPHSYFLFSSLIYLFPLLIYFFQDPQNSPFTQCTV